MTIDSRDGGSDVRIDSEIRTSRLTFLTGENRTTLDVPYDPLYIESGGIHASGGGDVWVQGLVDTTGAAENAFDVTGSTTVYLTNLRVAGDVDNLDWLPFGVEFPCRGIYTYEPVSDTTTIRQWLPGLVSGDR